MERKDDVMNVLIFGSWEEEYPRNKILIEKVIKKMKEYSITEINRKKERILKKLPLLIKKYDVVYIPYLSQKQTITYKLISFILLKKEKIVSDAFFSIYNTKIEDRKDRKGIIFKIYYYYLDKISALFSDIILLDTETHIEYFSKKYKIRRSKFKRVFICAEYEDTFKKCKNKNIKNKTVCFHGSFIPLQGVEKIVLSAQYLPEVEYIIIGSGITFKNVLKIIKKNNIKNVKLLGKKSPREIREIYCKKCDICLGIFGDTAKAKRVIPNKVYECISMGVPVITSNTHAIKELFDEKELYLCTTEASEIANKIRTILKNKPESKIKTKNAREKFMKNCKYKIIQQKIKELFEG